jgi:hypothetical protein
MDFVELQISEMRWDEMRWEWVSSGVDLHIVEEAHILFLAGTEQVF